VNDEGNLLAGIQVWMAAGQPASGKVPADSPAFQATRRELPNSTATNVTCWSLSARQFLIGILISSLLHIAPP
jgi:hypothetical protein